MKKTLENWGVPKGDTPFELFQAMHRAVLDYQGCEYRFGNAFFRHSTFKVFEMQDQYESYRTHPREAVKQGRYESYPRDVVKARFKLQKEVERGAAGWREAGLYRHRVRRRRACGVRRICRPDLHALLLSAGLGSRADDVALCRGRL